jgi:LysM repeat protein
VTEIERYIPLLPERHRAFPPTGIPRGELVSSSSLPLKAYLDAHISFRVNIDENKNTIKKFESTVLKLASDALRVIVKSGIFDTFFYIFVLKFFHMGGRLSPFLLLAFLVSLFSCKTYKPLVSSSAPDFSVQEYINKYKDLAVNEMRRTGIPASITLAQGIIESDCGHSTLAREANNHFGIKCHDNWKGATIKHNDNKRNECFRKYNKPEESFYDHSDFLKSVPRYSFLFSYNSNDYKSWAYGLKKAGYATNPDYANMLIRTIEENNLWNYDHGTTEAKIPVRVNDTVKSTVKTNSPGSAEKTIRLQGSVNTAVPAVIPRVRENNRIQYIIVRDGETREKLENEFQLLKWELARYNELATDFQPKAGQILYLQPKRDKAEPGKEYYTTIEGDTMYEISQRYGIKLKKLYELNRMAEGTEPAPGDKIWLRSFKPAGSQ